MSKNLEIGYPFLYDVVLSKFINSLMYSGKKSVAERIVVRTFLIIQRELALKNKYKLDLTEPLEVFHLAINNVKPLVQVKSVRVASNIHQVPVEISLKRRNMLAIRWIIASARQRSGKSMAEKLAYELLDSALNQGSSVKKRNDMHKMAKSNKAYSHFRW